MQHIKINRLFLLFFLFIQAAYSFLGNQAFADDTYVLLEDVAYGELPRQKLDVYIPADLKEKSPVVIFFHGGSWSSGDKAAGKAFAETLVANGIIAVTPNYRLYPEPKFTFSYFMEDAALSAKWVKDNLSKLNADPESVYLSGFSAGAYIAVMLSVNESYLNAVNLNFKDFAGTIASAGTYEFIPQLIVEPYNFIFLGQEWASQPLNFVKGNNQPLLILASTHDEVVPVNNAVNLAAKINQAGGKVVLAPFTNLNHHDMGTNGALVEPILNFIAATKAPVF